PGHGADPRRNGADAAVAKADDHRLVRRGGQPPVARPRVAQEVRRLDLEFGGLPLEPDGAVNAAAAAEDRGEPVAGVAVRGPAGTRGLARTEEHPAHPPGAARTAGAVTPGVLLGEHDRVARPVRDARDRRPPVPDGLIVGHAWYRVGVAPPAE